MRQRRRTAEKKVKGRVAASTNVQNPASETDPSPCSAPGPSASSLSMITHLPIQDRRASGSSSRVRYTPYSEAGKSEFKIQSKGANRQTRYDRSQYRKEDCIKHHRVKAIRQLDGLESTDLNSHQAKGQWCEILVDALEQVGHRLIRRCK